MACFTPKTIRVSRCSLSNLEAVPFAAEEMRALSSNGITFTLDVPRVAGCPRVFDRMIALAKQLAVSLGGTLVNDNRIPLADSALDVIHDKIVEDRAAHDGAGSDRRRDAGAAPLLRKIP